MEIRWWVHRSWGRNLKVTPTNHNCTLDSKLQRYIEQLLDLACNLKHEMGYRGEKRHDSLKGIKD